MSSPDIRQRFQALVKAAESGDHTTTLLIATSLKEAMLAEAPSIDPVEFGWVRHYQFRSLFFLKEYQKAWDQFHETVRVTYCDQPQNYVWRLSVASEIASHLGKPHEVLRFGRLCLRHKKGTKGDLREQVNTWNNTCLFLNRCGGDALNWEYARALADLGRETGIAWLLNAGFRFLLAHFEKAPRPTVFLYLQTMVPHLQAVTRNPEVEADDRNQAASHLEHGAARFAAERQRRVERPTRPDLNRALLEAILHGQLSTARDLLSRGADPNAFVDLPGLPWPAAPALVSAIPTKNPEMCRVLLQGGADPLLTMAEHGVSPLLAAVAVGQREVVRYLVEVGADLHQTAPDGRTAVHWAAADGQTGILDDLLTVGADPDPIDPEGYTPALLAAARPRPDSLKMLFHHGANRQITLAAAGQATLLHVAAAAGATDTVRYLMQEGFAPQAPDANGKTAIDLAEAAGHTATAGALRGEKPGLVEGLTGSVAGFFEDKVKGKVEQLQGVVEDTVSTLKSTVKDQAETLPDAMKEAMGSLKETVKGSVLPFLLNLFSANPAPQPPPAPSADTPPSSDTSTTGGAPGPGRTPRAAPPPPPALPGDAPTTTQHSPNSLDDPGTSPSGDDSKAS